MTCAMYSIICSQFISSRILRKLKREKRLTNKALATMMIPSLERISLAGVYLTERSFDIVASQGKSLKVLNIRGSGYVMNDHILEKMLMVSPDFNQEDKLCIHICHPRWK